MSYFYVLSCSECEVFRIPILLLSCCLLLIFLSGPCIFWFWLWGYIFQNFIHVNDWCVPLKVWTFFFQVFGGISNPGPFYSKFTDLVFFFDSLIEWFSLQTHIKISMNFMNSSGSCFLPSSGSKFWYVHFIFLPFDWGNALSEFCLD